MTTSRKKRKRDRRRAEATAKAPKTQGGQGGGIPTSRADLVLLRQAINEDWPVPDKVRQVIVRELGDEIESSEVRWVLSVARSFLAMESANIRAEKIG